MTAPSMPVTPDVLQADLQRVEQNLRTLMRVTTTRFPVAQTPKDVIWTLNKAKLYRYTPVVPEAQRHPVPLLLVFALMNRPYILDLRPGNSFVEYMVNHGYDVYLLDWGAPGPEDRNMRFDDYILDYLPRAIRKVKRVSGSDEFSLLGWCIGAILTTVYAALYPDDGLRNLLLLTAPLDFSDKQRITFAGWLDQRYFDVDRVLATTGNMPGGMIDYGAKALKPVENYLSNYVRLLDNLDNPKVVESWHAMNTWVTDTIDMAGATFRQLITDFYRENRLANGTLTMRGERVDLSHIRASVINVIAEGDHITPACQSDRILEQFGGSDHQQLSVPGGHIGVMAGSGAVKRSWPHLEAWLAERSGRPAADRKVQHR